MGREDLKSGAHLNTEKNRFLFREVHGWTGGKKNRLALQHYIYATLLKLCLMMAKWLSSASTPEERLSPRPSA